MAGGGAIDGPAPAAARATGTTDGVTLTAYSAQGTALLAFDLELRLTDGLAGFAVSRRSPDGTTAPLLNRLNFEQRITAETTPEQREWTPSDQAPFQKF